MPGRIEFLGKHTDYAGGPSLLCAIERGLATIAVPRSDSRVSIRDAARGERAESELRADLIVRQRHWSNYPFTVCRRVARNFPGASRGVDIAFASDLPPASGLSSSSALIVATFLALSESNELASREEYRAAIRDDEDLAAYLGAVENGGGFRGLAGDRGVGTQGGSEDHTAILCARPGALVQYSFAPIHFERVVPLPPDHTFVIAVSGVVAEKTAGALERYNRASAHAGEALRLWNRVATSTAPTLAAAIRESRDSGMSIMDLLSSERSLWQRATHLQEESALVRAAGDALLACDVTALGDIVDASQRCAELLLGNQVPETTELARSARALGAVAASAFGAGFGGSVYALVRSAEAEKLRREWEARYTRAFPHRHASATFFLTAPGPRSTKL